MRLSRFVRGAFVIVASVVATVVVTATPAHANVGIGTSLTVPQAVTVGQTGLAGSATVINTNTAPNQTESNVVTSIRLAPSCASAASAGTPCPTPDPGVFTITSAVGAAGTACAGVTFTVSAPDASGTVTLTPSSTVVLAPPGGVAGSDRCTVNFTFSVAKLPSVDVSPNAGLQTFFTFRARTQGMTSGLSVEAGPSTLVTVAPPAVRPINDFDGDFKSDVGVFRPTNGVWYIARSNGGSTVTNWGSPGDIPAPADYDGDGITDFAVFRSSTAVWYIARSSGGTTVLNWGADGDIPMPGDYDGDGKADIAVYRPATAVWYINRSSGGTTILNWGSPGDVPVSGDFDGDGKTDIGVFRPSTAVWYINRSSGGTTVVNWGANGDIPVAGDYDGDRRTDIAVYRPTTGIWYVSHSSGGSTIINWGSPGDVPVAGDYDGDGKTDFAVLRPSTAIWYINRSSGGTTIINWGAAGDYPVGPPPAIRSEPSGV